MTTNYDPATLLAAVASLAGNSPTQVTKLDTQELSSQIKGLDAKLNWMLLVLGLIVTLILSTYGTMAWFTWRLVGLLANN